MKKKSLSFIVIMNLLLLTGCWDQRELSETSLAIGMAVDIGDDDKYKVTIEAINAAELNEQTASGNSPTVTFTLEGNTVAELAHKMNIGFSKILIFSHMKTVVISQEIAEKGMLEFVDLLERNREIRDDFNFILVEGEAAEVLRVLYTLQKSSSLKLTRQLKSAARLWGTDPDIRLTDFINAYTSAGRQPIMAAVHVSGDPKKGLSVENMQKSKPDAIVEIDALAIFRGQKLIGTLPVEATRDYLWTQNRLKTTILSVPCGENLYMAIRVAHSRTKVRGAIKNGRPHIHLHIRAEGYLSSNQCNESIDDFKTYIKFEKMAGKHVEEELEKTIRKVQTEYGVDIFGFGEAIERENPKKFKDYRDDWDEVFRDTEIDVTVDMQLRRSGLTSEGHLKREGHK